jgi:transcriptional regulator with XRE-family HTH domain
MTRGRRSLIAVLQRTSAVYVAARCGVTKQAVSAWQQGFAKPSAAARSMLEANYRISRSSWDEPFVHPIARDE